MILYNLDLLFAVWSSPLLSVVKTLITTWHTDKKKKSQGVNFTSGELDRFLKNKQFASQSDVFKRGNNLVLDNYISKCPL